MTIARLAAAAVSALLTTTPAAAAVHPLSSLSLEELGRAVEVLKADKRFPEGALFPILTLREPPKAEVLAFRPGEPFRREAFAVLFDRTGGRTLEAVVDLAAGTVASWRQVPGAQPPITPEELERAPKIVRADPRWQEAVRRRGITDFASVMVDPWAPGTLEPGESRSVRWVRALSYLKDSKNGYARPLEGVVAVVDMNRGVVERVLDYGLHPVPPEKADLDEAAAGPLRPRPKPLVVTQPQGPSFEVLDGEVRWQKWRFRFSVPPREGLVLHAVGYEDGGRVRPVLYRAGLGEVVVPYGDPDQGWVWRNAFDAGEYGIGRLTDSLEAGTDAPPHAAFFDASLSDDFGKPYSVPRAVALYERDGGPLWKHYEFYNGTNDSRRARELVLLSMFTVANYDYGFQWVFRQDGSLELETLLTGIMLAKGVDVASEPAHGHSSPHWHMVAPYVAAPHHQHFFNFRLDLDVDGAEPNSVLEHNARPLPPGPANPAHGAFAMEPTVLRTELAARRSMDLASARRWLVFNGARRNRLGQNTAYLLVPGENSLPLGQPTADFRKRAGFLAHHLWATPYAEEERYAAGDYPNQGAGGEGLPAWTRRDRSLEGRDVVLWYTFGVTHVPRPEEWPVMPVHSAGFRLIPAGFFSRNPALDVPRTP